MPLKCPDYLNNKLSGQQQCLVPIDNLTFGFLTSKGVQIMKKTREQLNCTLQQKMHKFVTEFREEEKKTIAKKQRNYTYKFVCYTYLNTMNISTKTTLIKTRAYMKCLSEVSESKLRGENLKTKILYVLFLSQTWQREDRGIWGDRIV